MSGTQVLDFLNGSVHGGYQSFADPVLQDEVRGSGPHQFNQHVLADRSGNDDHRNLRAEVDGHFEGLCPVNGRQLAIEQNEVGVELFDCLRKVSASLHTLGDKAQSSVA